MASASKKLTKQGDFTRVNMITVKELNDSQEYQDIFENALSRLWKYQGMYENETDELRELRLDMEGPADDDAFELAEHFRKLYPDELKNLRGWAVIYTVYNRMKEVLEGTGESVPGKDSSEIKQNNSNIKEETKMAETKQESQANINELQESQRKLQEALNGSLGGDINSGNNLMGGAMPGETGQIDQDTREIVRKKIEGQQKDRAAFSSAVQVTKVLVGRPNAKERCVSDEGVIKDPKAAYEKFCELFGVKKNADESVIFTMAAPGQEEAAMEMYNALKLAMAEGDNAKFKIRIGDSLGSIRLIKVPDSAGGNAKWLTLTEFRNLLVNKAAGIINAVSPGIQFQAGKPAMRKKKSAGEGLGRNNVKAKQSGFDGLMSLKIVGRALLQEDKNLLVYRKELDPKKTEMSDGVKSLMVAKYIKPAQGVGGEKKVVSWRIPMKAMQKKLVDIADEEVKAKLPDGGVGRAATAINLEDSAQMEDIINTLVSIQAAAAASDREIDADIADIRQQVNAKKAASKDAEKAAMADLGV